MEEFREGGSLPSFAKLAAVFFFFPVINCCEFERAAGYFLPRHGNV